MPEKHTIGSISSATMKPEDLIPVFMDELETLDNEKWNSINKEYSETLENLEETPENPNICIDYLMEELYEAFNDACMPYFYFGTNEGDGADYGFWFDHESFETACQDKEILKLSDLSDLDNYNTKELAAYGYMAVINDHGNVTLYTPKIELDEVWAVV